MNTCLWYNTRFGLLLALAVLAWPGGAVAHTDDWFDTHPTPHGGQVRMAGPYHFELLREPERLLVYVTDHGDNAIPTAGWDGTAIVLAGGQKLRLQLAAGGDNRLQASLDKPLAADAKVVILLRPAAGEEYSARFVPTVSSVPSAAVQPQSDAVP